MTQPVTLSSNNNDTNAGNFWMLFVANTSRIAYLEGKMPVFHLLRGRFFVFFHRNILAEIWRGRIYCSHLFNT